MRCAPPHSAIPLVPHPVAHTLASHTPHHPPTNKDNLERELSYRIHSSFPCVRRRPFCVQLNMPSPRRRWSAAPMWPVLRADMGGGRSRAPRARGRARAMQCGRDEDATHADGRQRGDDARCACVPCGGGGRPAAIAPRSPQSRHHTRRPRPQPPPSPARARRSRSGRRPPPRPRPSTRRRCLRRGPQGRCRSRRCCR